MDINGLQVRIFPNDHKEKAEQPDYTCRYTYKDIDYKISGWVNDFKNKKGSYITIKFSKIISKEELGKMELDSDSNTDDLPF